jgi:hypothetical protein
MNDLTDCEKAILDFEGTWWKYAGAKEQEIRERFEISATRYYQILNALVDRPEARVYAPVTVKRLLRIRAARRTGRPRPYAARQ